MSEMALEINGIPYSGFTSATASKSMEDISGSFTFNVSALNDLEKFPIKIRSKCRVLVDGKPFITGYVETLNISYDGTSHQISVTGRDKTCDIIDNTVGPNLSFTAGISLQEIIKKILQSFGLENNIEIKSNVEIDVFNATELGNISSQIGEPAFAFIVKCAKKRQVLTMSDGDGNIILARIPKEKDRLKTILTTNQGYQGSILSANVTYDDTRRYYKYVLISQKNAISDALNTVNETDNYKMVSVSVTSYDTDIRKTRIYNLLQHEDSYNNQQDLQDRAEWEANYRMATGFKYSATVQGFSPINDNGLIWQPNMLVMVNDDYCNIPNLLLLIKSVEFKYSIDGGSSTVLELIDKNGYSIEVMQGIKYKKKRKSQTSGKKVTESVINDLTPYQKY